jgi:signal peptidase I
MTIENASDFFSWDVLAYLAFFLILTFTIVSVDRLLFKKPENPLFSADKKSNLAKFIYFIFFLKFNKNEKYKNRPKIVQWSAEFFPVLLFVFMLRGFLIEPFKIPSNSMMPTLLTGDFIVVSKASYGINIPIINQQIIEFSKP